MKTLFRREFGHAKLMIGMVHTLPLPGAPGYDRAGGMRPIVERALADAGALQDAGFHAVMFSNEFDMPYEMTMRRETIAAMTAVVMEARPQLRVPYGVNMLIDPAASVAIAHATGARFVRAYLTGAFAGDFGLWQGRGAEVQRLKAAIGARVGPGALDDRAHAARAVVPRGAGQRRGVHHPDHQLGVAELAPEQGLHASRGPGLGTSARRRDGSTDHAEKSL